MLKNNVCKWQRQKTNDKKVISFHLGGVFLPPVHYFVPYFKSLRAISFKNGKGITFSQFWRPHTYKIAFSRPLTYQTMILLHFPPPSYKNGQNLTPPYQQL